VVPVKINIRAHFKLHGHYNFESRYTKLSKKLFRGDDDTSSPTKSDITSFLAEIFYAHVKDNKMPISMTYYINILSTAKVSKFSNLTFDLVFLNTQYFLFVEEKYYIHISITDHSKLQAKTAMRLAFVKDLNLNSDFICIDEVN
jgi:hypothetical protein